MQIFHVHCIHKHFHTHYFSTYMHLQEICKFVTITCCRKNDQLFLHMNFIAPEHDLFTIPVCGSSIYPIKSPKSPLCTTPTLNSHTLTFFGLYVSLSVRLRLFSTNSVCTFLAAEMDAKLWFHEENATVQPAIYLQKEKFQSWFSDVESQRRYPGLPTMHFFSFIFFPLCAEAISCIIIPFSNLTQTSKAPLTLDDTVPCH